MIDKPETAKDRIILALDVDNLKEAEDLVRELKDYVGYFKIGLPLSCFGKKLYLCKMNRRMSETQRLIFIL